MSRSAALELLAEVQDATGIDPSVVIDTQDWPGPLTIEGWKRKREVTIPLAAAATDEAFALNDAIVVLLVSDQPFYLRLAAGETQLGPMRAFLVWGKDELTAASPTVSFLLSGNDTNEAIIRGLVLELP